MKQLEEIARVCLKQQYVEKMKGMDEYYLAHKQEIWKQYEEIIREGIEESESKGKKVDYIVISMLDSSLLTKSYELQIAFFDQSTYLDKYPVCRYWCPKFLFSGLEDDMRCLRKKASQKIVRLKEYETDEILKKYILNYYYQASILISKMTPEVMKRFIEKYDCISRNIQVLFGRYMDKPLIIFQNEENLN